MLREDKPARPHSLGRALCTYVAIAGVAGLLTVAAGCASAPDVGSPTVVADAVRHVAAGDVGALTARSAVPFLFDGEILNRRQDVSYLWGSLRDNGFRMEEATPRAVDPVADRSYQRFAETREVELFFRRYAVSDSVLVTVSGWTEPVLLLLAPDGRGEAQLLGIRVGER